MKNGKTGAEVIESYFLTLLQNLDDLSFSLPPGVLELM